MGMATFYRSLDFNRLVERARKIAQEASVPNPATRPGVDVCRFCEKYFTCPAVNRLSIAVPQASEVIPLSREDLALCEKDPEAANRVYNFTKFVIDWAKAYQEKVTISVDAGVYELADWRVVRSKGKAALVDHQKTYEFVKNTFALSDSDLLRCSSTTMGDLAEMIALRTQQDIKTVTAALKGALSDNGLLRDGAGFSYLKKI